MTARNFLSRSVALVALLSCLSLAIAAQAAPCIVTDAGGTAALPPGGCSYVSIDDDMNIIDGLPPLTTMEIDSVLGAFFNITEMPDGMGGHVQNYQATLDVPIVGTGGLAGFNRPGLAMTVQVQTVSAPRMLGSPVQSFDTEMMAMQGQLPPGDPDFDLLRITAGTSFGLPSPGHTTLTRLGPPSSDWNVDSFFDITYRIDFIGAPGGPLGGMSGSTTGTIRMSTGMPIVPEPSSFALVGMALCGIGAVTLRRRLG